MPLLLVLLFTAAAAAQKNDVGVLIGGHFPVDTTAGLSIGAAFMVEGSYARQIAQVPLIRVAAELPVVASFNSGLSGLALTLSGGQLIKNYSSVFVTPGLKVAVAPSFPLTPYFVAGLGVAHFRSSNLLSNNTPIPQQSSNHFAVDLGAGLDIKFLPVVGFRFEMRDIFTGVPTVSPLLAAEALLGLPTHQHNLLADVGVTLRF